MATKTFNRDKQGAENVNPAGMTFDEYLKRVGYKALVFPSFSEWLKKIFDYNGNGKIDKGKETRGYKKAVNNTGKNSEYLAEYESEHAAAVARDEATVENLRILWYSGNLEEGAAQAARDAQHKEKSGYVSKSGMESKKLIIMAVVIVAALLIIKE